MKQFYIFVQKEFYHILRDKRTMLILIVMPIILVILFGFAITTEVKNTRIAILDLSKDQTTSKITEQLAANNYFTLEKNLKSNDEIEPLFHKGKVDMVVIFSENFDKEMKHGKTAAIQLLTDGSEPNQASIRSGYATQILLSYLSQLQLEQGARPYYNIIPTTKMLYNPQQRSEYNFVPGVIGLILMLICAMMTSIAIVREKEMGTMEILLASPLPPAYIVLAKLVPYFVISAVNLITILLLSVFLLGIPIAGNLFVFLMVSIIYILVALLLGLLISTVVKSQLAAMLLSLLLIVPTVYLSGLAFPIESMPVPLQRVSAIVPTRWYIEAARKLMIQGVEAQYVLRETTILIIMGLATGLASWRLFKIRLE